MIHRQQQQVEQQQNRKGKPFTEDQFPTTYRFGDQRFNSVCIDFAGDGGD
jgi:hypothetical protein